mgnify:CR=1 FL=1
MPAYSDTYIAKKHTAECIDLFNRLADARMIRVGQVYNWPIRFQYGFDSNDLFNLLAFYANAAGFTISVSGDQLTITGVYP